MDAFALRQRPLGGKIPLRRSCVCVCGRGTQRSKVLASADMGTTVGPQQHGKRLSFTYPQTHTCTPTPALLITERDLVICFCGHLIVVWAFPTSLLL